MDNNNIDPRDILDNSLNSLLNKYGLDVAINHLNKYIESGNNRLLKSDSNVEDIEKYLNKEVVKDIVTKASHTTEDYDLYIYERVLGGAEYEFKTAVLSEVSEATIKKYDSINQNQLKNAIKQAIHNDNYSGFTKGIEKDKNLRYKLKNTVHSNEIEKIMKIHLQKEGLNLENMDLNEVIDLYNDNIYNKVHIMDEMIDSYDDKKSTDEKEKVETL